MSPYQNGKLSTLSEPQSSYFFEINIHKFILLSVVQTSFLHFNQINILKLANFCLNCKNLTGRNISQVFLIVSTTVSRRHKWQGRRLMLFILFVTRANTQLSRIAELSNKLKSIYSRFSRLEGNGKNNQLLTYLLI